MKEYRTTEYDSMRRDLDEHTTRMWKELKEQREAIEWQEQQTQDMTKQEQRWTSWSLPVPSGEARDSPATSSTTRAKGKTS